MDSKEIEVLKGLYAAINRNDIPAALQDFHPQIVRIEPAGFPSAGTYRGLAEVEDHFVNGGRANWAEGACEPEKFVVAGDKVVVFLHVLVRLKDQVEWIDGRMADVFTFREGKIIEMRSFADGQEALAWAGAGAG